MSSIRTRTKEAMYDGTYRKRNPGGVTLCGGTSREEHERDMRAHLMLHLIRKNPDVRRAIARAIVERYPEETRQTKARWAIQQEKIDAIKDLRNHTGLGLKEAKEAIDEVWLPLCISD